MLSVLQNRFPGFISDICRTFGTTTLDNGRQAYIIPSYITPQVLKYCKDNNNPTCNDFITKIPTWFLSNHCENRNSIISKTKENIIYDLGKSSQL